VAGVNEVTLFRRFGDKGNLVRAAIHARIGRFGETGTQPTGHLAGDLLRVVGFYCRMFEEHGRFLLTLITEAARNRELAELLHEPLSLLTGVDAMIASYQAGGQLRAEPVQQARNALIGPLLAHAVTARIMPNSTATSPTPGQLVATFLHGHAAATDS
jgi:AcrR family transcriptional regulator